MIAFASSITSKLELPFFLENLTEMDVSNFERIRQDIPKYTKSKIRGK